MKTIFLAFFLVLISACSGGGDSPAVSATQTTGTSLQPTVLTPSPTPTASPSASPSPAASPSPSPSPSPTVTPYSCSIDGAGYVECSNNIDHYTTPFGGFVAVATGTNLTCAIQDTQGAPVDCPNYATGGCANPPVDAAMYCWTQTTAATLVNPKAYATQIGGAGFDDGALSLFSSGGQVCVRVSAYFHSNPIAPHVLYDFFEHDQICGDALGVSWSQVIQP